MDDQNVYANKVADETARQLFAASRLRLAISPEMSDAYQEKFDLSFSPLPPVLDSAEGRISECLGLNQDAGPSAVRLSAQCGRSSNGGICTASPGRPG